MVWRHRNRDRIRTTVFRARKTRMNRRREIWKERPVQHSCGVHQSIAHMIYLLLVDSYSCWITTFWPFNDNVLDVCWRVVLPSLKWIYYSLNYWSIPVLFVVNFHFHSRFRLMKRVIRIISNWAVYLCPIVLCQRKDPYDSFSLYLGLFLLLHFLPLCPPQFATSDCEKCCWIVSYNYLYNCIVSLKDCTCSSIYNRN